MCHCEGPILGKFCLLRLTQSYSSGIKRSKIIVLAGVNCCILSFCYVLIGKIKVVILESLAKFFVN